MDHSSIHYKVSSQGHHLKALLLALLLAGSFAISHTQTLPAMTSDHPLLCDPDSGICEIPGATTASAAPARDLSPSQKITVIYFTDPICSSCWGIEPQLRKLKMEYPGVVEIEYHMGGLLPDWSYNSGGISQPSDVARHWDEVSGHCDMPIDGDVWLDDPLDSSYPPSIAFKAAQMQSPDKALLFLRAIREMVFLEKKNIARWEHLAAAARAVGLDVDQLQRDYTGAAQTHFEEDLQLARALGVRGFPTLYFRDAGGNQAVVYGSRPYAAYTEALHKMAPEAAATDYPKGWTDVFGHFPSLTAREFSVLTATPRSDAEATLDQLADEGHLEKLTTKNGALWKRKNSSR